MLVRLVLMLEPKLEPQRQLEFKPLRLPMLASQLVPQLTIQPMPTPRPAPMPAPVLMPTHLPMLELRLALLLIVERQPVPGLHQLLVQEPQSIARLVLELPARLRLEQRPGLLLHQQPEAFGWFEAAILGLIH